MSRGQLVLIVFLSLIFWYRLNGVGGADFEAKYSSTDARLEGLAEQFVPTRDKLAQINSELLPEPQAGLLSGIVLGAKGGVDSELKKTLVKTSTIHIAVASGQNLTLVAGFLMGLTPILGRKKTLILVLASALSYSLLSGMQVPILRALIMFGFGVVAQILGKEKEGLFITLLTGLLMLIYHPEWLYSVSFQLSFMATLGVIVLSPLLISKLELLGFLKDDVGVTISVFLLTLPIISSNFHQLSLIGLVVNSLVLWVVPILMIGGAVMLLLGLIIFPLAELLSIILQLMLNYFLIITGYFSTLSWGIIYIGKISLFIWLGYYLLIFGLMLILKNKAQSENMI